MRLRKILHGSISALASRGVALLVSAVSLPLTVRYLGPQRYGIWITASTAVVMLAVMDFGIANSLTNMVSGAYARNDERAAQQFYSTAFWTSLAISISLALSAYAIWGWIDWGKLFHLSEAVQIHEASLCVAIALGFFLLGLPLNLINRVMSGYQQTQISNYFNLASSVLSLGAIMLVIRTHGSLVMLMLLYSASLLSGAVALNFWVHGWHKPWVRPIPEAISRDSFRLLMNTGVGFFVLQIAGLIVFNSDNLVITHYLGPAQVTPYSVTWRLAAYAALLQTAVFPSLWPAYSEAYARGDYAWVRRTFWRAVRLALGSTAVAVCALAFFGRTMIRFYVGGSAVPTQTLLVGICTWTLLSAGMDLQACLLAAIDRIKWQGILSVVAAALNIALSVYLVQRIGSLGVVLGTLLSYLIVLVGPQTIIVWRALYRPPLPDIMIDNSDDFSTKALSAKLASIAGEHG